VRASARGVALRNLARGCRVRACAREYRCGDGKCVTLYVLGTTCGIAFSRVEGWWNTAPREKEVRRSFEKRDRTPPGGFERRSTTRIAFGDPARARREVCRVRSLFCAVVGIPGNNGRAERSRGRRDRCDSARGSRDFLVGAFTSARHECAAKFRLRRKQRRSNDHRRGAVSLLLCCVVTRSRACDPWTATFRHASTLRNLTRRASSPESADDAFRRSDFRGLSSIYREIERSDPRFCFRWLAIDWPDTRHSGIETSRIVEPSNVRIEFGACF